MTHLEFATNLAQQAGAIMRQHFQFGMQRDWKSDHSPLTLADTTINRLVLDATAREYPSYAVLSEEGSRPVEGAAYTWVCDPIDGTIPFSYGVPVATFSLALVRAGQPMVAVVFDPFLDRLFTAETGGGAFWNGTPIRVSSQ